MSACRRRGNRHPGARMQLIERTTARHAWTSDRESSRVLRHVRVRKRSGRRRPRSPTRRDRRASRRPRPAAATVGDSRPRQKRGLPQLTAFFTSAPICRGHMAEVDDLEEPQLERRPAWCRAARSTRRARRRARRSRRGRRAAGGLGRRQDQRRGGQRHLRLERSPVAYSAAVAVVSEWPLRSARNSSHVRRPTA
jgi:hypothetical protein